MLFIQLSLLPISHVVVARRRRRLRRHRRRQISILIFGGAVAEGGREGEVDVGTPQFEVSFLSNLDLSVMITMERARGEEASERAQTPKGERNEARRERLL